MEEHTEMDDFDEMNNDDPEMHSCCVGDLVIVTNTRGAINMTNKEYPVRYGLYCEIRTREYVFSFNPTGEIRYIRGLTQSWPHPREWLKRTWGNDWVYYTVGLDRDQGRVKDWMGEYYLPCLSYESNAIRDVTPYSEPDVAAAFSAWSQVYGTLASSPIENLSHDIREFITSVIKKNDDNALIHQKECFHKIIGGRVTVLPPDTRHVDYEVIPLNIADGCLYRCKFCSVKSGSVFKPRSIDNISEQIEALKIFYGASLQNLNALFIGDHDALAAGIDRIVSTTTLAFEAFGFDRPQGGTPSIFLFGSAGSFLKPETEAFEKLNNLPCKTYINLGLESFDELTLNKLGKPITPAMVKESLLKMVSINKIYKNIEVTANFLLGTTFSDEHHSALINLLGNLPEDSGKRGCLYLSPLVETQHREEVLPMFHRIKEVSMIPAYIYLIQRL